MENHVRARKGAYLLLVNLSIWRLIAPIMGYMLFSISGMVGGLVLSLLFHYLVRDYMGFRLLSLNPISKKEDFIELKRWMVPAASFPLSATGFKSLESEATPYAIEYLSGFSTITNFNYANACMFDEQFGKDKQIEIDRLSASNNFFKNSKP